MKFIIVAVLSVLGLCALITVLPSGCATGPQRQQAIQTFDRCEASALPAGLLDLVKGVVQIGDPSWLQQLGAREVVDGIPAVICAVQLASALLEQQLPPPGQPGEADPRVVASLGRAIKYLQSRGAPLRVGLVPFEWAPHSQVVVRSFDPQLVR